MYRTYGKIKNSNQNVSKKSYICHKKLYDNFRKAFHKIKGNTCLVIVISSYCSYPRGLCFLSRLSNVMLTVAFVIPA